MTTAAPPTISICPEHNQPEIALLPSGPRCFACVAARVGRIAARAGSARPAQKESNAVAVEVIQHASHLFASTGICSQCSAFRGSYAASRGCRGGPVPEPPRPPALPVAAPVCSVCEIEPGVTDVQIREGGPVELLCLGCLRWLRDALSASLVDALATAILEQS